MGLGVAGILEIGFGKPFAVAGLAAGVDIDGHIAVFGGHQHLEQIGEGAEIVHLYRMLVQDRPAVQVHDPRPFSLRSPARRLEDHALDGIAAAVLVLENFRFDKVNIFPALAVAVG